ncbi:hypothetical protein Airi02_041640 [Actinoallomurus iriomotensis]|uniref:Uncharacterized protein n=1 Tax=Actinoallomurus iriomotensis TaxID=478107 RepID=A0A9W6S1G3_9ACTN|nr:hypothetical protein Airi02_041640 [Actinoallomurus iriomotensis]
MTGGAPIRSMPGRRLTSPSRRAQVSRRGSTGRGRAAEKAREARGRPGLPAHLSSRGGTGGKRAADEARGRHGRPGPPIRSTPGRRLTGPNRRTRVFCAWYGRSGGRLSGPARGSRLPPWGGTGGARNFGSYGRSGIHPLGAPRGRPARPGRRTRVSPWGGGVSGCWGWPGLPLWVGVSRVGGARSW